MARAVRLFMLAALCVLLGMVALHAETVIERLVSPGALSHGHARLETRCSVCHLSFQRHTQDRQCLACHTGIARDLATQTRWHGRVPAARNQPCRGCHAEHKGIDHPLTVFSRRGFDHDHQTAYPLTGGHARIACTTCHDNPTRFRETPQACAACHAKRDVHQGRLGPQCQTCHTTAHWRNVLPFDHDTTRYPLTGAHKPVACLGCHIGEKWHGVPTACVSCHLRVDVHRGADGPKCEQCHVTGTWRTIRFDHDSVRAFPLQGAHRAVACIGCHARAEAPRLAPVTCNGCHRNEDVHRGSDGPQCATCHSQTTWKVAKFDHAKTSFPLLGSHARVNCAACHPQSVDKVKVGARCIDCHRKDDVHHGGLGERCEGCHKQDVWRVIGPPRIIDPIRRPPPRQSYAKPTAMRDFPRSGLKD